VAASGSAAASVRSSGSASTDSVQKPPVAPVDNEDTRWNSRGRSGRCADRGTTQRPTDQGAESSRYYDRRDKKSAGSRGLKRRAR